MEGLCDIRSPDDKDTIRVEIDLGDSGLEYTPGDALGIYASNAPEVGRTPACCSMQRSVAAEKLLREDERNTLCSSQMHSRNRGPQIHQMHKLDTVCSFTSLGRGSPHHSSAEMCSS